MYVLHIDGVDRVLLSSSNGYQVYPLARLTTVIDG